MTYLRGWSDRDIMECDLRRLTRAIEIRAKADARELRERYRIAGFKNIEEPVEEPKNARDFNASIRQTLQTMRDATRETDDDG